jgi:hypothetical protein
MNIPPPSSGSNSKSSSEKRMVSEVNSSETSGFLQTVWYNNSEHIFFVTELDIYGTVKAIFTWDCWIFHFVLHLTFQKNETFRKLNLFLSSSQISGESPTHLGPLYIADLQSSFRNAVFFWNTRQWKQPSKSEIQIVIHHLQDILELKSDIQQNPFNDIRFRISSDFRDVLAIDYLKQNSGFGSLLRCW